MNYRFDPEAECELHEACDYYEAKRESLGGRFGEAFREALARVLQRPLAWGLPETPYRLCRLKRFPYGRVRSEGRAWGQTLFTVYGSHLVCHTRHLARPPCIQFAGAIYHAMACGNGRQPLFHEDDDYRRMTDGLERTVARTGWEVFA
jgi:hypothetical protein